MRLSQELNSVVAKRCKRATDVWHSEVDRGATLRLLARRNDTNQDAHVAAIEERHLRRGGEQEGQAKHVAIERDTFFNVVDGDQELSDIAVGNRPTRLSPTRARVS